jgi:hypothetical protein
LTEALNHLTFKEKIRYAGAKQAWDPQAFCSPADCPYRRSTGLCRKVNAFALEDTETQGGFPDLPFNPPFVFADIKYGTEEQG